MPIDTGKELDLKYNPLGVNYFDRQGELMSQAEWIKKLSDYDYRIVKLSYVNGAKISTVWLGLDHNYDILDCKNPIIFETMNFPDQNIQIRYSTEKEAVEGHEKLVEYLKAGGRSEDYNA